MKLQDNVRTERLNPELKLPERFRRLAPDQQRDALQDLSQIPSDMQQHLLNEWDMRCQNGEVLKPVSYLFGLLKKARNQQFRPHACLSATTNDPSQKPPAPKEQNNTEPDNQPAPPEVALKYLAKIKEKLRPSYQKK